MMFWLLLRELKSKDAETRKEAVGKLAERGGTGAMKPLISALKDGDWGVCRAAAQALTTMGWEPTSSLDKAYFAAVNGKFSECEAFGPLGVEPLILALTDVQEAVRVAAVEKLGNIGDVRAVIPLTLVLKNGGWNNCCAVAEALEKMGYRPTSLSDKAWFAAGTGDIQACAECGHAAVEPLILALKAHDRPDRITAARALGSIGDTRAVRPLLLALNEEKDYGVRASVHEVLAKIGVEPIILALKDRDWGVRSAAAESLGNIREARAVQPLIRALKDEEQTVRLSAAVAMGRIGDESAVDALVLALRQGDWNEIRMIAGPLKSLGWQPTSLIDKAYFAAALGDFVACENIGPVAVAPLILALIGGDLLHRFLAARSLTKMAWQPTSLVDKAYFAAALGDFDACVNIGPVAAEPVISALKDREPRVRGAAAEALGKIGDDRAVRPLVLSLKDEMENVRISAAVALGKIGDEHAVHPLILALRDWKETVARSAAAALVSIGTGAVEPLVIELNRKDGNTRMAASILGKIGDSRAVEPLITALKEGGSHGGKAAAEALGEIGDPRAVQPLIRALKNQYLSSSAGSALVKIGSSAVEPLILELNRKDDHVGLVANLLGSIGDGRAVEPLLRLIREGNYRSCQSATSALEHIGSKAVDPLILALKYDKKEVRSSAAEILGEIGDGRAIKPLILALDDENRNVNRSAEAALGKMGPSAVEALIPLIENNFKNEVRFSAVRALGEIGDARCFKPLILALNDKHDYIRELAIQSLARLGPGAIEPLIGALKNGDWNSCFEAARALKRMGWQPKSLLDEAYLAVGTGDFTGCSRIGEEAVGPLILALKFSDWPGFAANALGSKGSKAVGPLIVALKHDKENVRSSAVAALVKIGSCAVEPLILALKDDDENVGSSAALALREVGGERAVEPLLTALKDKKVKVRSSAATALGGIGSGRIVDPLLLALKDEHEEVRSSVATALGEIGDTRAIEPLAMALDDGAWIVSRAIARALKKMGWQPARLIDEAYFAAGNGDFNICAKLGSGALKPLVIALKTEDPDDRRSAVIALGTTGDARAVQPLIMVLKDENEKVRSAAAYALGMIGDTRAVDPLELALKDDKKEVRRDAAYALRKIGDPRAMEAAASTLKRIEYEDRGDRAYSASDQGLFG